MLSLGVETSGRAGAVALCRDGCCLEELRLSTPGRRHAQTLVAEVGELLRRHALSPSDCNLVAVSIGPGSFTGLRVGVVFAKTFAYATGCRVAAVDTFLAIAAGSPADVSGVFVIDDAQRGELFVGAYRRVSPALPSRLGRGAGDEGLCGEIGPHPSPLPEGEGVLKRLRHGDADGVARWQRIGEIVIENAAAWFASRGDADVVTGPGVAKFETQLPAAGRVLGPEYRSPRASIVAQLGAQQVQSGSPDDVWGLKPFYLRASAAEEKWAATHGK